MWPSALLNGVGTPNTNISQLNTRPAGAPVNASMAALRLIMHDSGSGWFAKPSLYDSFIHYPTPVYPGALNKFLKLVVFVSDRLMPPLPGDAKPERTNELGDWVSTSRYETERPNV